MLKYGKACATLGTSLVALAALCGANSAGAQQAPAQASPPYQGGLEEIKVTAQRRSENLQDVPIAVSALDASKLEASGITRVEDLEKAVPGTQFSNGGGVFGAFIRGVGTGSTSTVGQESGVALYVDDVYIVDTFGGLTTFGDVDRIEILKGPQGTLYGRNATGGLINIITPEPQADPLVRAKVGYESYGTYLGSVYATGALADNLQGSLSFNAHQQREGFGRDVNTGQEANYTRYFSGRTKLRWEPTDHDHVSFSGDYLYDTSDAAVHGAIAQGTIAGIAIPGVGTIPIGFYPGSIYNSQMSYPDYPHGKVFGASVKWEHTFDNGMLFKSISAYRQNLISFGEHYDADFSTADLFSGVTTKKTTSFQQEFLLQGHVDQLDYTTGLFYFTAREHFFVGQSGPAAAFVVEANNRIDSYSPYGQVDYHVTDKDTLTAGVRFTVDKQGIDGPHTVLPPFGYFDGSKTFSKPTWRAAYKHEFADELIGYVSYSRGFRSGLFNGFALGTPAVAPETLDDFEGGFKGQFLDNRLRVDLSGFYYIYKNLQLNHFTDQGGSILGNAGKAKLYGAELQSEASIPVPVGDLQLSASLSFLHTDLVSYLNCTKVAARYPLPGNSSTVGDCSGNELGYSPKVQMNAGVNYTVSVGSGKFGTSVNYYHSGKYYFNEDNFNSQDAYDNLDVDISYSFADDRTRVRVYGTNLTDAKVVQFEEKTPSIIIGFAKPPRIFGAEIQYTFK